MKILVTGSNGFIGRNLIVRLRAVTDSEIVEYDLDVPVSVLDKGLVQADVIFHLAGVNRPGKPEDYTTGNTGFTQKICDALIKVNRNPLIVFSSSIQAVLDNPYGISKRAAEDVLLKFADKTGSRIVIFRMKNVFGKWCQPNYNSAVATFCHNIARNLPVTISNRTNDVSLVYVNDVCSAMMECAGLIKRPHKHFVAGADSVYAEIVPSFNITLGEMVDIIHSFKDSRLSLQVPSFEDPFTVRLYATYLSYLEESNFAYDLDIKKDERGCLAEFLKKPSFGQIFVSRTKPGMTRGNHYHHTKTEKFLVIQGEALIRFRKIVSKVQNDRSEVIEYRVKGEEFRVLDIPPGYTHSIENVGQGELITLFWANQIFDSNHPDTYFEVV